MRRALRHSFALVGAALACALIFGPSAVAAAGAAAKLGAKPELMGCKAECAKAEESCNGQCLKANDACASQCGCVEAPRTCTESQRTCLSQCVIRTEHCTSACKATRTRCVSKC